MFSDGTFHLSEKCRINLINSLYSYFVTVAKGGASCACSRISLSLGEWRSLASALDDLEAELESLENRLKKPELGLEPKIRFLSHQISVAVHVNHVCGKLSPVVSLCFLDQEGAKGACRTQDSGVSLTPSEFRALKFLSSSITRHISENAIRTFVVRSENRKNVVSDILQILESFVEGKSSFGSRLNLALVNQLEENDPKYPPPYYSPFSAAFDEAPTRCRKTKRATTVVNNNKRKLSQRPPPPTSLSLSKRADEEVEIDATLRQVPAGYEPPSPPDSCLTEQAFAVEKMLEQMVN